MTAKPSAAVGVAGDELGPEVARPLPAASSWANCWLVSPPFDLLFVANIWWLAAWAPGFVASDGAPHIEFWQIYFLTTPHRWITLILVATDPDRRGGRPWLFAALAIAGGAAVVGVKVFTGAFLCLVLIDYVWNAWHFAAQHAGVLRMYSRKHGGGRPRIETWCIRLFVFYVVVRLAGWSTGWTEPWPTAQRALLAADIAILALPALLLLIELVDRPWKRPGKLAFLTSVCCMYGALLGATVSGRTSLILALVAASAAFHAVEYLAVVSVYAWRREQHGSAGLFRELARHWLTVLAVYVACFGLAAKMADGWAPDFWLGLNLWAAFLHYAFDGMIWKLRRPETAAALGVEIPKSAESGAAIGSPQVALHSALARRPIEIASAGKTT